MRGGSEWVEAGCKLGGFRGEHESYPGYTSLESFPGVDGGTGSERSVRIRVEGV